MREIALSGKNGTGLVALVDDEDHERVIRLKWHLMSGNRQNYAIGDIKINGKWCCVRLHRFILNLKNPKIFVDHIDHNGLNCQRVNMRTCSNLQNIWNSCSRINSTSKYKGVYLEMSSNRFKSEIRYCGKKIYLGRFKNEIDAAKAYDKAAHEFFKEFAYLNFPNQL